MLSALACSAGVFFERAICSRKRHVETFRRGNGASQRERGKGGEREEKIFFSPPPPPFPSFVLTPTVRERLLFLLSPIFHCHKIKDGGYNNITNTNKVSLTQNTPALQAISALAFGSADNTYLDLDYSGYHKNLIQ